MDGNFPKILIVNQQSMFNNNQTSITLRNIFSKWPNNCLMEVHLDNNAEIKDEFKGMVSFKLSENSFPLRKVAYEKFLRRINQTMKEQKVDAAEDSVKTSLKQSVRQWLFSIVDRSPMLVGKFADMKVKEFAPDVIYTMGSNIISMKLTLHFADVTKKPVLIHFMDNWPESIQWSNNRLLRRYQIKLNKLLDELYKKVTCGLTISSQMAVDYEKKRNIRHIPLMNAVDITRYYCGEYFENKDEQIFVYAGGLHLGRVNTLKRVADGLKAQSRKQNISCKLQIYTSGQNITKYKKAFDSKNVEFFQPVNHDSISHIYKKADVLVHVESLNYDEKQNAFSKYSVSTKIPEYLSAGRVIFYAGASELYMTKYLLENEAAAVAVSADQISERLDEIVSDIKARNKYLNNAISLAKKNHSIDAVNTVLRDALKNI